MHRILHNHLAFSTILMPAAALADQVLSAGDWDTIAVTSPSGKTKLHMD
jgi:hypothetical protein